MCLTEAPANSKVGFCGWITASREEESVTVGHIYFTCPWRVSLLSSEASKMLLGFLGQLWNTVNTPSPQEHYMPLGNVHWKIRGCRNLSVCGCSLQRV